MDPAADATTDTDVLPNFKTPTIFYPLVGCIVVLVIILFIYLFNIDIPFKKQSKSTETAVADIFIILFFLLIIFVTSVSLLPNFKDVKNLFNQISSVTYIIIYTIFLILFFTMTTKETIDKFAYIITPITILLGVFMFYKGFTNNYVETFNINYERIKTMIIFLCLITIFIIYYDKDPGGYIQNYFGYSLLLTIIISVFAFLYLIIVITLPDTNTSTKKDNLLNKFSGFSTYGSIAFLLFIIITTIGIKTYPGGFFNDQTTAGFSIILILIICILSSLLLGANLFPEITDTSIVVNKLNLFKRSLLTLFGIIISSLIIFWLVYTIQNSAGNSGTNSLILNLLLVTIVLSLIYRTINVKTPENAKKNGFFNLIYHSIFYIPCIFGNFFDNIVQSFTGKNEKTGTTPGSILIILFTIALIIIYFRIPNLFTKLSGGKMLVNRPVYTDVLTTLATYEELNDSDVFDYQYAISCWIFLDSSPPNTNVSYSTFTSLLNFGNKPNILFNGTINTLMITMQQKDLDKVTENEMTEFDENNNRILYKNKEIMLQKWNNIIINYSGGTLDIFLNGELVKSAIGVVPYYTFDQLTIGEENGIKGGICNVVYFKRALTSTNISYIYNSNKDKSPPVSDNSNDTIIKDP